MSSPEFPIYISEVNCESLLAFRFTLPEQGIGRDDIVIYVEYGITSENTETITYNVWAQFRDSLIRAFLCPGSVPGTLEAADIIPKIMYREREILRLRYEEGNTIGEIAVKFSVSKGRIRQIESKALARLRYPYRWNYIKMGITGFLQYKAKSEYNRGYSEGHRAGYKDGFEDGKRGVTRELGPDHILNQPLEQLNLSVRSHNCLVAKYCKTIGDVARLSEDQIRVIRNFGRKSAAEVAQKLKDIGITNSDWDIYLD